MSQSQENLEPTGTAAPWTRWANWVVAAVAGVLLLISLAGYVYHRGQLADIAADHVRLQVVGPSQLHAGVDNPFDVVTTSVTGGPVSAQVEFGLVAPDGTNLMPAHYETTGEKGRLQVQVPASLELPPRAVLKLTAVHQACRESLETSLLVQPIRFVTHVAVDKPFYRPGETVRFRSLTVARFSLTVLRESAVHFEIQDSHGAVLLGSPQEGITRHGVGSGQFTLPADAAAGLYKLVARSLNGAFPEAVRTFQVVSEEFSKAVDFADDRYAPGDSVTAVFTAQHADGEPGQGISLKIKATVDGRTVHDQTAEAVTSSPFSIEFEWPKEIDGLDARLEITVEADDVVETITQAVPVKPTGVAVAFFPEGGDLAAELLNRVYFTARDGSGEPIELTGRVVNSTGEPVARVETTLDGMGQFSFQPRAGERYRLQVIKPSGIKAEPRLPPVFANRSIVLSAGKVAFKAGEPLEFNVRSLEGGVPLVAAARCRGVALAQVAFVTSDKSEANPIVVPLDDHTGGVIRLTVYDYSASPPQPVAERLVYREPARVVNVSISGHDREHAPGDDVTLTIQTTDENGKPLPATLSVAVVDAKRFLADQTDSPSMPTDLLLASEIEQPAAARSADFYLSQHADASLALRLVLGTQGWLRFLEQARTDLQREGRNDPRLDRLVALHGLAAPPLVFDNLGKLQDRYQSSLDDYHNKRTRVLNTVTTFSFFGGAGLLLAAAMLTLLNIASGMRIWLPAVAAAAACLVVGVILMDPERLKPAMDAVVAFAPFHGPSQSEATGPLSEDQRPAGTKTAEEAGAKSAQADANLAGTVVPTTEAAKTPEQATPTASAAAVNEDRTLEEPSGDSASPMWVKYAEWLTHWEELDGSEKEALEKHFFKMSAYQLDGGDPAGPFAGTAFWCPLVTTDASGRAEVRFALPSQKASFRIMVDALADRGRVGWTVAELESKNEKNR